jgi:oligogalacturonide transport system permease protein
MKKMKPKKQILTYIFLVLIGVMIIYPFLWLIGASFNDSYSLFANPSIFPEHPSLNGYINGWKGGGANSFGTYFANTYRYVLFKVLFTIFSCIITAYGFSRFEFPGKKPLFSILIGTLLFPSVVVIVPTYIIFSKIGWVDTYAPMLAPALFAGDTYFVYLLIQFFRSIPRDMDEAAMIDGCGPIKRLTQILLPMLVPSIVTVALFQFIWTGNDFMYPMIFLSSESKFPVSVGLKIFMDTSGALISWGNIFAMSVLAIVPPLLVFLFAQRTFVEGISTSGLKG